MFQDGPNKAISSTSWCNRAEARLAFIPQSIPWYTKRRESEDSDFPFSISHEHKLMLTCHTIQERTQKYGNILYSTTDFIRFPFNNFKYYLTLFSKFFSSFPHGTCSLSVSCRYLALDGIYHPLRTALPSNPTRWKIVVHDRIPVTNGVFTLHDPAFQLNSTGPVIDNTFYRLQFKWLALDLQVELIPLHSPLLRES